MENITEYQPLDFPTLQENYKGISTSYTLVQQGYTANISCMTSSSPTINLNNSASLEHTFETPSGAFNYTLQTWSWSTNCSGNEEYYAGEVNILTSNNGLFGGRIGNGLFATSVCFFQNFSGPSNQSFLFLMQSPNNSGYNNSYFMANPNLPTVCQFTPIITTLEVQYNDSGTANINRVLYQALPPDDSWPLASIEGFVIWGAYFLAQGPYSNSLADDPLDMAKVMNYQIPNNDVTPILEQYLRGIFEYMGSVMSTLVTSFLSPDGEPLPDDMSIQISGTMNVQTVGWKLHPRTHGIALAVITIVTMVTAAAGIFAIVETNRHEAARESLQRGSFAEFDPTNLMDVLVASSMGNLGEALSQPMSEEHRKKLTVELSVTDGGQTVLNVRADVVDDDDGKGKLVFRP
ncbi:hypothetical protein V8E55_005764 [Tylopilus felleus]